MEPPGLAMDLAPSLASYQACLTTFDLIKNLKYRNTDMEFFTTSLTLEYNRFSMLVPQLMILQEPVLQRLIGGNVNAFKATLEEFLNLARKFAGHGTDPNLNSGRSGHKTDRSKEWTPIDAKRLAVLIARLRDLNDQLSYLRPEFQSATAGSPSDLMAM